MGRPTEQVSFTDGPYLMYTDGGITNATTDAQVVGADFTSPIELFVPPASPEAFFIEPGFNTTLGQTPMDNFARILFSPVRFGLTAANVWTGTLSFKRGTGGEEFAPPELTDILIPFEGNSNTGVKVLARLPMDFMRDPTGATFADTLRCSFTVTPGNPTANSVSYTVFCVPIISQSSHTNPPGGRGQVAAVSIQGNR